jgi:hypothetical protein
MPPRRNSARKAPSSKTQDEMMSRAIRLYKSVLDETGAAWMQRNQRSRDRLVDRMEDISALLSTISSDRGQSPDIRAKADHMSTVLTELIDFTEEKGQTLVLVTTLLENSRSSDISRAYLTFKSILINAGRVWTKSNRRAYVTLIDDIDDLLIYLADIQDRTRSIETGSLAEYMSEIVDALKSITLIALVAIA